MTSENIQAYSPRLETVMNDLNVMFQHADINHSITTTTSALISHWATKPLLKSTSYKSPNSRCYSR